MSFLTPTRVAWVISGALLFAAIAGALGGGEYVSFHYVQLGLTAVGAVWAIRAPSQFSQPLSPWAWRAILVGSLVWLLAISVTAFLSFNVNAIDFSIFDWMIENTVRGQVGQVPLYRVNHFAVHSTFLMFGLVPVYAVAPSPWWLLILGPVLLWAGLFPLKRLVEAAVGDHGGLLLLAAVAWVASCWMGRLANSAFRVEHFEPLWLLWFLAGWVQRKPMVWGLAVLALFASKEDASLMLAAFGAAHVVFERERRREGLVLAVASLVFLVAYSRFQAAVIPGGAGYGGFWLQFGNNPSEAAVGMLRHPLDVAARMATSGVWGFFAPMLFLPFMSWRSAVPLGVMVLLFGAASFEPMHRYQSYYPAVLQAFAVFGIIEVAKHARGRRAATFALALFPVVGFGYARASSFVWADQGAITEIAQVVRDRHVCAQGALLPRLGYPPEAELMVSVNCPEDSWVIAAPDCNPTPLEPDAFRAAIDQWKGTRKVHAYGPFLAFEPLSVGNSVPASGETIPTSPPQE